MAKLKVGDLMESEFGVGPVVAITKEWVAHETDNGEAALSIEYDDFGIAVTEYEQGGGQDGEVSL